MNPAKQKSPDELVREIYSYFLMRTKRYIDANCRNGNDG